MDLSATSSVNAVVELQYSLADLVSILASVQEFRRVKL